MRCLRLVAVVGSLVAAAAHAEEPRAMKLAVRMTPTTLAARGLTEVTFTLALTNGGASPVTTCARGALDLPNLGWPASFTVEGARAEVRWLWELPGAPAPPDLSRFVAENA